MSLLAMVSPVFAGALQRDRGDAERGERLQFAGVGLRVVIGVDPHAQIVEIEMAGRDVGPRCRAREAGRAGLREAGERRDAVDESSAVEMDRDGFLYAVDLAIAVEIERENAVLVGDPAGLMLLAVAERVEEDVLLDPARQLDAVAVEIEHQRIDLEQRRRPAPASEL